MQKGRNLSEPSLNFGRTKPPRSNPRRKNAELQAESLLFWKPVIPESAPPRIGVDEAQREYPPLFSLPCRIEPKWLAYKPEDACEPPERFARVLTQPDGYASSKRNCYLFHHFPLYTITPFFGSDSTKLRCASISARSYGTRCDLNSAPRYRR